MVANELRALDELPLESENKFYLHDHSENGRRIYEILRKSEKNHDVSLLEEAGQLLWQQSMKLPPHWQSPSSRSLPPNDLPDDVYRFSPMSNDPFAKAGCVRTVECKTATQHLPATKSLEFSHAESRLKESEHCAYPELLINPPERWIKNSPRYPQPMPLIQPAAFVNSYPRPKQQSKRQIAAKPTSGEQREPVMSKKPNPVKSSDTCHILKPAPEPKSKAKASKKQTSYSAQQIRGSQGFQNLQQQPAPVINPSLLVPSQQQVYWAVPPPGTGLQPTINTAAHQSIYSNNANRPPVRSQAGATHPTTNLVIASNPDLAIQNQFPAPSVPGFRTAMYSTAGYIPNQQPYHPTADQPHLPHPSAIRTPTTPIPSNQQAQLDMPWLSLTPGSYTSVTTAAQAIGTQPYDEVYRIAKETAENLAKALGKK